MVFHTLEGLVDTTMLIGVDMVENALFILEEQLEKGGTVFDCKIKDSLGSGILINVHIDLIRVVRTDVKDNNVAVILEHLRVFIG